MEIDVTTIGEYYIKSSEEEIPTKMSLDEYLSFKFQFKPIDEILIRDVLMSIEIYYMINIIDHYEWNISSRYRNELKGIIEKVKFEYYKTILNQSHMSNKDVNRLIDDYLLNTYKNGKN